MPDITTNHAITYTNILGGGVRTPCTLPLNPPLVQHWVSRISLLIFIQYHFVIVYDFLWFLASYNNIKHLITVPEESKIYCFLREQSLSDLLYAWKCWSWKTFFKPRCNSSRRSTNAFASNSALLYPWRHRFCNVARSEILAGNSFTVRSDVTSK